MTYYIICGFCVLDVFITLIILRKSGRNIAKIFFYYGCMTNQLLRPRLLIENQLYILCDFRFFERHSLHPLSCLAGYSGQSQFYKYRNCLDSCCHFIENRNNIFCNRTILFFCSAAYTNAPGNQCDFRVVCLNRHKRAARGGTCSHIFRFALFLLVRKSIKFHILL